MLKIGDFSKLSRISIRMLRHYDEIGILHPECVDDFTGYRYYSEAQLPLAGRIQALKNLGFGLSVIKEILAQYEDAGAMEQFLLVKRKELEEKSMEIRQNVQQAVPCYGMAIFHDEGFKEHDPDVEIQSAVAGNYQDTEHVKFKTVPPIQIASATYKGSYDQISRVNAAVANWVVENGYDFDGKSFCIYHVSPGQTSDPEELVTEVCFPVKRK